MKINRKKHLCSVCGVYSVKSINEKRHGSNCQEHKNKTKNRGTIKGFSNYYINMTTGVLFKVNGKRMATNINKRGNKVCNLTDDFGRRKKVNLDREWKISLKPDESKEEILGQVRSLISENNMLKRAISSDLVRILLLYYEELSPETKSMSDIMWTNYILNIDHSLDRGLIRDTILRMQTGVKWSD
jgi:hypothetical protein